MGSVLITALKKEQFENILNGTSDTFELEKTAWQKKRIVDQDTGKPRDFDRVKLNCPGFDVMLEGELVELNSRGKTFKIKISGIVEVPVEKKQGRGRPKKVESKTTDDTNAPELNSIVDESSDSLWENVPNDVQEIIVDFADSDTESETMVSNITTEDVEIDTSESANHEELTYEAAENVSTVSNDTIEEVAIVESGVHGLTDEKPVDHMCVKDEQQTVIEKINELIRWFINNEHVYLVDFPYVLVQSNGMITRCRKRLPVKLDYGTMYHFENLEIEQVRMTDDEYLEYVKGVFDNLTYSNYVFLQKRRCGVSVNDGKHVIRLSIVTKKVYSFK